jgi:hypothetical protein
MDWSSGRARKGVSQWRKQTSCGRTSSLRKRGCARVKIGGGREIKRLNSYLWDDEHVERMTTGTYGPGTGLLTFTDRRMIFIKDG